MANNIVGQQRVESLTMIYLGNIIADCIEVTIRRNNHPAGLPLMQASEFPRARLLGFSGLLGHNCSSLVIWLVVTWSKYASVCPHD